MKSSLVRLGLSLLLLISPCRAELFERWAPLELEVLILRDPALKHYFHLAQPERGPIPISAAFAHPDLRWQEFGYSITIVHGNDAARAFQYMEWVVLDTQAEMRVAYPAEGLTGHYWFVRERGNWVIQRCTLLEH